MKSSLLSSYGAIFFGAVLFGHYGVLERFISPAWTDLGQPYMRIMFCFVWIALIGLILRHLPKVAKKDIIPMTIFGAMIGTQIFLWVQAALYINVAVAIAIAYAGIITVSLITDWWWFKEKPGTIGIVSVLLAMTGFGFLAGPHLYSAALGIPVLLALIAGSAEGFSHSFRKKLAHIPKLTSLFWQFCIPAGAFSLFVLISGSTVVETPTLTTTLVTFFYAGSLCLVFFLFLYGFARVSINAGAIVISTEVLIAMIATTIWLHEAPTLLEMIGGCIIFTAAILRSATDIIAHRNPEPFPATS